MDENYEDAFTWLKIEAETYQSEKFNESDKDHPADDEWWADRIEMYIKRAETLGLDNPLGRQAIAKAVATSVGMLAAVFRDYEWIPQPGVPSGEIRGDFPVAETSHEH